MKRYLKYIFVLLLIILIYLIGNWFPIDLFRPDFVDESNSITNEEWYKLIISIFATSITVCAVIVALFKDDIREWWKYARAKFSFPENITIEIINPQESSSDSPVACKYVSRIQIQNCGNLPLLKVEICLDKLEFIAHNSTKGQFIEVSGKALKWNGTEETSINIPPGRTRLIDIAELIAPEKFSLPDSQKSSTPSSLIIGGHTNKSEDTKGKWIATFSLCAENHKEINFVISIVWTGLWKTRLTDMSTIYIIEKHS